MDDTNVIGANITAIHGGQVTTAATLAIKQALALRDAASTFSFTTLNADFRSTVQIAGSITADIATNDTLTEIMPA